ncbi:MAG: glycosyltransferase family 2 protein [Phenylobacterium sp.]|nr:MAG: glycosyltransferase family 2 protein [Phenylobacterium sp.]
MKLSALVCAHNDEARLADCLRGLSFCDEIVVVADRCTDRSQEIARQFGARVIDGIFPLESQRKTAGLSACLGEWVLEIEPDEAVGAALAYEIRAAIHGRPAGDWFDLPVDTFVGDRAVRHGWGAGLGETRAPRLYRQAAKRWKARRVQPPATMDGRYAGVLETPLVRRADPDVGHAFARLNQLAALRAQDLADAGRGGRLRDDILAAAGRFWTCYVWRQGVREGELGFLIALMAGLDAVLSGARARELLKARAAIAAEPAIEPAALGVAARR